MRTGNVSSGASHASDSVRRPPVPHALLLNASYEPLCVVSQRRAVVLILSDKAVTLEGSGDLLHAATWSMPAPSVIRLTRYIRVPNRRAVPLTRRAIFARDGGRCVYCDAPGDQHRPCDPAFARRTARLGQRRLGLPPLQPCEGGPSAAGPGLAHAPGPGTAGRFGLADPVLRKTGPALVALFGGVRRGAEGTRGGRRVRGRLTSGLRTAHRARPLPVHRGRPLLFGRETTSDTVEA